MNPKIVDGSPLDCYMCGKKLIQKIDGKNYRIEIQCNRCGSTITIQMDKELKECIDVFGKANS